MGAALAAAWGVWAWRPCRPDERTRGTWSASLGLDVDGATGNLTLERYVQASATLGTITVALPFGLVVVLTLTSPRRRRHQDVNVGERLSVWGQDRDRDVRAGARPPPAHQRERHEQRRRRRTDRRGDDLMEHLSTDSILSAAYRSPNTKSALRRGGMSAQGVALLCRSPRIACPGNVPAISAPSRITNTPPTSTSTIPVEFCAGDS